MGMLGFFTRTNCCLSFLLGWYFLGLDSNFGKVGHGSVLPVFALAALAFSRCGDAFSLDSIIRRLVSKDTRSTGQVRVSAEYTWPIRLIQVLFCLLFMGAGLSKLRNTGIDWIASDNMQNILLLHFYCGHHPVVSWGRYLAQYPLLCQSMAGITILIELFAPLALFRGKFRAIIIPMLFGMQLGIWLLLGVSFFGWMAIYIVWIPWDILFDKTKAILNHCLPHLSQSSVVTPEIAG
jgi:hypothetical protein